MYSCSIVKQLIFEGGSPDENDGNLVIVQVRYCCEHEGQASQSIALIELQEQLDLECFYDVFRSL